MTMFIEFVKMLNFFFVGNLEIFVLYLTSSDEIRNAIMLAHTALLRSSHSPIITTSPFFITQF